MKNRLQFNRHFALYETREEAINALNNRITDPGFIPLIGEPIVLRYKDAYGNVQAILAIGKKAGKSMSDRDYHIVDTADLDEKIAAEVAAREALDAETIKKVIFDGVESEFADNIATLSVSANSIPIGAFEEYVGPATHPHPIHDNYTVLDAVKQIDTNFIDFTDKTNKKVEGLHLVKVTTGLDSNVREAYDLVNLSGIPQENSERILIYKDSSLYRVYLGHVDDRLDDHSSPVVTSGVGDTALCFIYLNTNGTYDLAAINVESFLEESEFMSGVTANENHIVHGVVDPRSEAFLTVGGDGFKLAGVQDAINAAQQAEETRATGVEGNIQSELDMTQAGAGLKSDGTYKGHDSISEGMAYITTATSIDNATVLLDKGIQTETGRATLAEQTISGIVNTFSAATEVFSAATVAEIARVDGRIDSSNTSLSELSASTETFSANTVSEVARLDTKIEDEEARATAAENSISADVTALSSATKSFSSATVAEIARIDATAARNKVKSTGNTILVTEPAEGTNIDVNIDNKTILSDNGVLGTGLKVVPVRGELETNVREAFVLVDNLGNRINDTVIKIYKSSSLVSVELINVGGNDCVRITYIDNEGVTKTMDLNIQQLIFEAEFKDGLVVNGSGEVRVEIDPDSESFLTVSQFGVKLSGVQNAINAAVATETTRAKAAEDYISGQVVTLSSATEDFNRFISGITRNIISGAGLSFGSEEGMYPENHHSGATVIGPAKSLDQADILLDLAVAGLSGELLTLSSTTEAFSGTVKNKLEYMSSETTSLSASVVTLSAKTNEIESEVSEAINDVNTRLNNVSGDVINLSAITAELAEEVTGLSKYEFFGDEDGVIKVTAEPVIDPTTREEYTKVTTKPAMASNNIPDWDYINNSAITGSNGLVTAYQVKQYVKDGLDGDATWVGDKTLPIPEPGQENPLVGRINFDKESQFYDTVHEAFYKVDNDLARLADTIGLEDAGYNAFFYPSARTEGCLIISTGSGVTDIMSALTSIDKFIDNMDWSGKTNENQVFTYLEQENGTISAGCGNIANVKLADYQEVPVTNPSDEATKVKATDTLGQGLGKLQGQINAMDWSGETTINEVFVKIEEKDGLISATTANITGRKLAGYELGGNNKVAADQSLGQALGNLQGQINALNYTGITGDDYVFTGLTETSGLVSTTSALITSRKLAGYSEGTDDDVAATDTLGQALGKLQKQINSMDYTANTGTDKVITGITQDDGKVVVTSENITNRVITGYEEGTDADVTSSDTLGTALGKLQAQINAMDKTASSATGKFVRTVAENDGKVSEELGFIEKTDITICAATASEIASLGTNVKEAYKLVNARDATPLGQWIKIYKDSSLKNVELSGDTSTTGQWLVFTYILEDGSESKVAVDVSKFLVQAEFQSGVTANNAGIVHGVVDTANSESVYTDYNAAGAGTTKSPVLSVDALGFKVSNIQTAIDAKVGTLNSSSATTGNRKYVTGITIQNGKITSFAEAGDPVLSVADSQTGNVVTGLSVSDHAITLNKKNFPEVAWKRVTAGGTTIDATATADTISIVTGNTGITLAGDATNKIITISHTDTSSQASVDAGAGKFIKSVTLDTYGHVSGLTTGDTVNSATTASHAVAAGKVDSALTISYGSTANTEVTFDGSSNKTIYIPNNTNQLANGANFITSAVTVSKANSATTAADSDKLGGTAKVDLFTSFTSPDSTTTSAPETSITVGGTEKKAKVNADMVDGLHFVTGGTGTEANTIYFL